MMEDAKLPMKCYTVLHENNEEVVLLHRGMMGYSPTRIGNLPWYGQQIADELNAELGVSKAQAEAMLVGSMFGWNVPGADPAMYDENGKPKDRSISRGQGKHK